MVNRKSSEDTDAFLRSLNEPGPIERVVFHPLHVAMMMCVAIGGALTESYGLIFSVLFALLFTVALIARVKVKFLAPISITCLFAAAGLAPHALFLIMYDASLNDMVEPRKLPALVASYENAALDASAFLSRIGLSPAYAALASISAFFLAACTRIAWFSKPVAEYQKWVSRAGVTILAATTFSLAAVAPTVTWSRDLPARIKAVRRVTATERARLEVQRAMLRASSSAEIVTHLNVAYFRLVTDDVCTSSEQFQQKCSHLGYSTVFGEEKAQPKRVDNIRVEPAIEALGDEVLRIVRTAPPLEPEGASTKPAISSELPSLSKLREESSELYSVQAAAQLAHKQLHSVLRQKIINSGDEFSDKLLNKVVDTFVDEAAKKVFDYAVNAAKQRGGGTVLNMDMRVAAGRLVGWFYQSKVKDIYELDDSIASEVDFIKNKPDFPARPIDPNVGSSGRR